MKMRMSIINILIVILFTSCNNVDRNKELQELIERDIAYSDYSLNHGVVEAFMEFAADSVTMLPMNELPITNKLKIREHLLKFNEGKIEWKPIAADVSSSGDIGYTWGNYVYSYKDKSNVEHRKYGKYVTVWKKQKDGYWKWVLDIGNNSPQYIPLNKFDPERNPFNDLQDAIDYASTVNKRIILDVGGEWCKWCHRLDDFIEKTSDVKNLLERYFVVVKINYSKENKNEEFLKQFPKIKGFPHFFILESDGTFLYSQDTSELEEGKGYSKEKFIRFLNKWKMGNG